ncbi:MAG: hypothetical protein RL087_1007, partial [Pseudomonadota bacterium]
MHATSPPLHPVVAEVTRRIA